MPCFIVTYTAVFQGMGWNGEREKDRDGGSMGRREGKSERDQKVTFF